MNGNIVWKLAVRNISANKKRGSVITAAVAVIVAALILSMAGVIFALIAFIAAYLLVYNILNISVIQDTRFYRLAKTFGASPKQIRGIAYRQVLIPALIGMPAGMIAAAVISFSPLEFLCGILLSVIVVFAAAYQSAIKAENISHVETAIKPLSRGRKRAVIMFISLFFGGFLFTFTAVLLNSMDMQKYVNAQSRADNDFVIYLPAFHYISSRGVISEELIDTVRGLPGVTGVYPTAYTTGRLIYQTAFDPYTDRVVASWEHVRMAREYFTEHYFSCFLVGIDAESLNVFEDITWDIAAWERGEFAVILSEVIENFADVHHVEGRLMEGRIEVEGRVPMIDDFPHAFSIPIGGVMPYYPFTHFFWRPDEGERDLWGVELLVSIDWLTALNVSYGLEPPPIVQLGISSDRAYDESLSDALGVMVEDFDFDFDSHGIELDSQARARLSFAADKRVIASVGIGGSIILLLMGIQYFIGGISESLIMRKKAVSESKGLIYEVMISAVPALCLGIGAGTAAIIFAYFQFESLSEIMIFSYPPLPVAGMAAAILLICISVSAVMRVIIQRDSVDRRKEEV